MLDRPLADVRVVDMREEYAAAGPDVILSAPLCESLTARLGGREQAIVLLNRRGFATAVVCRQCGQHARVPELQPVADRAQGGAPRPLPLLQLRHRRCRRPVVQCAGEYLEQVGFGTERVEAEVRARFPGARVDRVDRDTMRRRGAIAGDAGAASPPARSTCWSARRCSRRGTISRG